MFVTFLRILWPELDNHQQNSTRFKHKLFIKKNHTIKKNYLSLIIVYNIFQLVNSLNFLTIFRIFLSFRSNKNQNQERRNEKLMRKKNTFSFSLQNTHEKTKSQFRENVIKIYVKCKRWKHLSQEDYLRTLCILFFARHSTKIVKNYKIFQCLQAFFLII